MPTRKQSGGVIPRATATVRGLVARFARSGRPATVASSVRDPQPLQPGRPLVNLLKPTEWIVCPHVVPHAIDECPAATSLHGDRELAAYRRARAILEDPASDLFDRASATQMLEYLPHDWELRS